MIGKYLNGYSNNPPVPPGWSEWYAAAPNDQDVYNYTLNENGTLVHYGQDPADFKQDVLTGKAVDFVDRRAPKRAAVLPLAHLHGAPRRRSGPEPEPALQLRRTPPSRRRATPMPSTPSRCRSPRTSTRRTSPTSRPRSGTCPLLSAGQIADIQRKYRCELESLLSVDEGVKKVVEALRANGELDNTLLDLHLRQRLLPRRAPDPERQAAHLRGVDPGAAPDARARASRRG